MNKDTLIGSIVLGIIVIASIGYVATRPVPVKAPVVADTSGLPADHYAEHAKYYDITADYATSTPLLASVGKEADASAVALMKNYIKSEIDTLKSNTNFDKLTPEDIKMYGFGDGRKFALDIKLLIAPAPHTVSYIYTVYSDTLGAHPNAWFHTFVFDLKTGKSLSLSDLFTTDSKYLETLSILSKEGLIKAMGDWGDKNYISEGTTPEEKNFKNFFFEEKDLVILFDPYQVGPWAAGPQTLRIPLSDLSSILKPDYR